MNRKDGIKVKDLDPISAVMPHLKNRNQSEIYINYKADVTNLVKYYETNKKKDENLTYFHLFSAAFSKVVFNRPLLNRFVIDKKYYDRKDVTLSFVAKPELTDEAEYQLSVVKINENDNIFKVKDKLTKSVSSIRNAKKSSLDNLINMFSKLPKFIISLLALIIKFLDNKDLLPKSFTNDSIYHSTVLISNLGSIDSDAIYHNLTNFGTNSIIVTIGKIKKNGNKYYCEFGVTIDERIADGFYLVKSLKLFEDILNDPYMLEEDLSNKIK